jgi:hypothetical protein
MFIDDKGGKTRRRRGRPGISDGQSLSCRFECSTLMERGSAARGDGRNGSEVAGTDGFPAAGSGECEW